MGESPERCRYAGEGRLSRAHVSALRSDAMKSPARSADPSGLRRRIKPHTRRDFLIQSAALAGAALAGNPLADAASDAARKGGRIAMINSECRFKSHAYHFGRRFMEGYEREGFHHQPSQAVVRMFKDKHPANDLAAADSERFHFERCNSVGDALGGKGRWMWMRCCS